MILVMNVLELASSRSSVRRFKRGPVPLSDIRYILDVARRAPSGANRQPWRFLVVRDDEIKQIIRRECEAVEREFHKQADPSLKKWLEARGITWEKPFLTEAPFLILVFGRAGEPYWIEGVWLAIGFMLLAIRELGYSTLTYTPSKTRWANKVLRIPGDYRLQAILPIGKSAEPASPQKRLPLKEIAYLDGWRRNFPEE